jgi:TonB-dependent receptor
VVPLDLFPSSLLQTITTAKTFTPDLPGDFAGAQVDIRTREFPARRSASYSASIGYNAAGTGKLLLAAPRTGSEWMGFAGPERRLPQRLGVAGDLGSLSRIEMNEHLRSLRGVWSAREARGTPNSSFGVAVGGEDPILGHDVGYVASVSYAFSQEVRAGETRATAIRSGETGAAPYNVFTGSSGRTSVLWGGVVNLTTWLGRHTKLSFDNTYSRGADNEAHSDEGFFEELGFDIRRTTLKYVERSVRSHRLRAQHVAGERHSLDWALTASAVTRNEPDRSDIVYGKETDVVTGEPLRWAWLAYKPESARRNFGELRENALGADVAYALKLGAPEHAVTLKVGGAHRATERDADSRFYNILGAALSHSQREGSPEEIFDGRYAQGEDEHLTLTSSTAGGAYAADEGVTAGFAMADVPLGGMIRVIGGARVERWTLGLEARPVIGEQFSGDFAKTDVLPSLTVNLALTESQNIRLSASRTLSRPEYRELAPITYREALGDQETFGNPSLRRALIENYDVRWEWYPRSGEALSLGVFGKRFTDPIERIDVASTGKSQLSFANAGGGDSYGVEIEARKGLEMLSAWLPPLTVFANATLMHSEIRAGADTLSALTNPNRPMLGQAPYVVNAGLGWSRGRASATALFNVVGKRVAAAGVGGLPDTYEMPRNVMDLSTSVPIRGALALKLDAKNLLDAPHIVRQGSVVRERYTTGRVFSLGLSWRD